ncbi:MAG: NfeD family protein, partial [Sediminibacterium sp.]|nr:NfeD family protein [Sediminibacterium sp.]
LGLGFILASIFAFFNFGLLTQVLVFGIFEIAIIIFFLPKIKKKLYKPSIEVSNVGRLINMSAIVTKLIKGTLIAGEVKIEGETWKALANNEDEIHEQTLVKIVKVDSTIVIVEKIK